MYVWEWWRVTVWFEIGLWTRKSLLQLAINTVMPEPGGQGSHWSPQYFADQLTLFEAGRADYPHLLLLAPPMFFTFRHHRFQLGILF